MNSDDKEVDRARGIGISSSESEPDSETDDEAENEAEEEEDIYDKDNPRRSGKITSTLVEPNKGSTPLGAVQKFFWSELKSRYHCF